MSGFVRRLAGTRWHVLIKSRRTSRLLHLNGGRPRPGRVGLNPFENITFRPKN